jgi:hypothetical protein
MCPPGNELKPSFSFSAAPLNLSNPPRVPRQSTAEKLGLLTIYSSFRFPFLHRLLVLHRPLFIPVDKDEGSIQALKLWG